MKRRDLINLLNRAAAYIETPRDLSDTERNELIEDLVLEAQRLKEETETPQPEEPESSSTYTRTEDFDDMDKAFL